MVQMYVWLVVAVLLAVGVLLLALAATRGDGSERPGDGRPRTLSEAAQQTWLDFRSGARTLRARLTGGGRPSARPLAGMRGQDAAVRAGAPARVPVLAATQARDGRSEGAHRPTDAWTFETPQDTTIDDFFAATQTSEPAYLDTTQMTDVLHRRR